MKRSYYKILAILIAFIAIITIFYRESNSYNDFNIYLSKINKEREYLIDTSKPVDLSEYMVTYEDENDVITIDKANLLTKASDIKYDVVFDSKISSDQAKEDISYTFEILKYGYGAYEYFGGDEVFNKTKDLILLGIEKNDEILVSDLESLLFTALESIIIDNHFKVHSKSINQNRNFINYFNSDYYFFYEDKKYYTSIDNKKYFLKEVTGEKDLDVYMKKSINENGELTYVIGEFLNENLSNISKKIILVDDAKQEIEKEIQLKKGYRFNKKATSSYEEYKSNGVKILDINSMKPQNNLDYSLEEFVESGSEHSKESILIIDLRGNHGGINLYANEWIKNYIGKDFDLNLNVILKRSLLNLIHDINILENKAYTEDELPKVYDKLEKNQYGFWESINSTGEFIDNDNLIFVLTDKDTASAGETFVEILKYLENVIVVGENTSGAYFVGNNRTYILPNSKLNLYFGDNISYGLNKENMDGIGMEPDIWTNSSDALDLTLKLIEKYDLN